MLQKGVVAEGDVRGVHLVVCQDDHGMFPVIQFPVGHDETAQCYFVRRFELLDVLADLLLEEGGDGRGHIAMACSIENDLKDHLEIRCQSRCTTLDKSGH